MLLTARQRVGLYLLVMGTLRFLLALTVAYGHLATPMGFPGSDTAVQCFFVISGFYMSLVLNGKYGPGTYWLFLSNRILRLWPSYLIVLILSLIVATNWRAAESFDPIAVAYLFASQLLIVGQDLYLFLFSDGGHLAFTAHIAEVATPLYSYAPIPQAWTLSLEIYFYLLAPFLVRRGPVFIAAAIAASFAVRLGMQWQLGFSGNPWSFRFFPSEIGLFLAGSLGYCRFASMNAVRARLDILLVIVALLAFAGLALNNPGGLARWASLVLLSAVIVGTPRLFDITRDIAWDRYLGELSYPLYICHFLFGWMLLPNTYAKVGVALLLSMLASMALYHLVDRPVDRWRQQRFARKPRTQAVAMAAA